MAEPSKTGILDMTAALQVRKQNAAKRRAKRILVGLLVLLVALAAGWLLVFSSVFTLRSVEVTGLRVLTVEQVEELADAPAGLQLVRLDVQGIADRVATLAPVKNVHVALSFPATLSIEVEERTAVVQHQTGGVYQLVDDTGFAFFELAAPDPGLLIVQTPNGDRGLLADAGVVAGSIPEPFRSSVDHIVASTPDLIVVYLTENRQVVWGSCEQTDLKAEVAWALLTQVPGTVYDVSAPSNPAVR